MINMTLYASTTNRLSETNFQEIPYYAATLEYNTDSADSFTFKTNKRLPQGTRIRYEDTRGKRYGFGGQVHKSHETLGGYEYDCVGYQRLYMSNINNLSVNKTTSSNLLRKLLRKDKNHPSIAGITKTTNTHTYLKWEKKSIWEIAKQLQYLEWKAGNPVECYVDIDGVLRFGKKINTTQGYHLNDLIIDYEDTYTMDDVVTVGRVTYDGGTRSLVKASKDMIATWGYIEGEAFDCTETITKTNNTSTTAMQPSTTEGDVFVRKYDIPAKIVKQSNNITGNVKGDKQKAKKIWEWMRDKIKYEYYACTRKGAMKTLQQRKGNCADQTHLYMSLAGSAGLQVRCNHINGHFYPQTRINGKWLDTDTVTSNGWGGHWGSGHHLAYYTNPNKFNC